MEKLPNFENAYIGIEKLTEYSLNELHHIGKEKAIVFKSVLGLTSENAILLKEAIFKGTAVNPCIKKEKDKYGERFSVNLKVRIFEKEATITTGWIIKSGEDFPRLTTCYINRKK